MTDYLAIYDNAKQADKYPLVQKWMKQEPLPFFKQLRKERPILETPECTLVTLFSDITNLLKMPKIFTVALYRSKMGVTDTDPGYLMAHDDDALHYREKSLMQGFLNRDDLPEIRKIVSKACKDILHQSGNKIEVVCNYCRIVPAVLVQDYFGLNGVEKEDLLRWSFWNQYDSFHNQPFDLNSPEKAQHISDKKNKVSGELVKYIALLIARKVTMVKLEALKNSYLGMGYYVKVLVMKLLGQFYEPRCDNIVTRIFNSQLDDDVDFDLARKGINVGGLLIGSIETTSQAVSQTLQYFLDNPKLLDQAKAAAQGNNPELFDAMVWEALRFVPISPYMFRQAAIDYTLAKGTNRQAEIKAGTNVLLVTQSAMFDEYAFDDPDSFDPDRNWYHHFNFGFGSHECLGKYVGMVLIPEMVRHILSLDDIKATGKIDYKDGPFPESYHLSWNTN